MLIVNLSVAQHGRDKSVLPDIRQSHLRFAQVPKEESIAEIRDRYLDINSHAASYNWKALKTNSITSEVCCLKGLHSPSITTPTVLCSDMDS